ncbi:MAG: ATP-dependent DNA helicase RecG, partial [Calditrichaeota bacterium]|nr:ATP-dependent DNA helicase RecG [Calditrichota bacterium]
MNQNPLNIAVEYLKGVGPRRAEVLNQAGVATLGDLLEYRPRRYLDRSTVRRIRDILPDEEVTVVGTVISKRVVRGGKRRLLVRIED